jgi:hypothetical protein
MSRPAPLKALEDNMKRGTSPFVRRFVPLAVAGILVVVLAACTGRGGGYLPPGPNPSEDVFPDVVFPDAVFSGPASFGFTFSCEDKGGVNPPTGQLRIELSYTDHGSSVNGAEVLLGSPFSIHGIVDSIAPIEESMFCSGQEPPDPPNPLIFLGRYRQTSGSPTLFPATCPTRETPTSPLCRFEVIVEDNDGNQAPSMGDFFSIKLSSSTAVTSTLPTVFYARAGYLAGGNLTVD